MRELFHRMKNRKEVSVNNNPGIYRELRYDTEARKWVATGKYRALRRVSVNGRSKKEQAFFDNIEEAKAFRAGSLGKTSEGANTHRLSAEDNEARYTFNTLVEEWKPFHYLKLEVSTQQTYEKRLPALDFLRKCRVEEITTPVIDSLVKYWVTEFRKTTQRQSFDMDLDLLKTILNFYRRRKNPAFVIPVLEERYQAADIAKKAERPVESLSREEIGRFLEALRTGETPHYYPLALAQFCLGLRIGEVCGLHWEAIDFENRAARIEWTVDWHQTTWEARIKPRPKNGKIRYVALPEILAEELARLRPLRDRNVPLVFHQKGRPLNRRIIGRAYNRVLARLGIKHVSGTHMLRKTAATLANELTGDFYAVSKLLDHSNPNITLRYVAQTSSQKRKVAEALNSVLVHSPGNAEARHVPQCPATHERPKLRLVKSEGCK